ncbi:hypothetical protein [Chitinilyticum litopenaei]|uniref:hypothetical protein n=1 Tax=Chitinilyticum litopenaei TaxID=1121276 RepID=UPI000423FFCD|nr:hypothetical protein [Chitinilyticum litopenaei]
MYTTLYRASEWLAFREQVLAHNGHRCRQCGRGPVEGVTLQAHHLYYLPGQLPWQYPLSAMETLCSGCHAREHGVLRPQHGWELLGIIDHGGLTGHCELCGHELRHGYLLGHPQWPPLQVGCQCAEALTGQPQATPSQQQRCQRFMNSRDWTCDERGVWHYRRRHYRIDIHPVAPGGAWQICINTRQGSLRYPDADSARLAVFTLLANNTLRQIAPPPRPSRKARTGQKQPSHPSQEVLP